MNTIVAEAPTTAVLLGYALRTGFVLFLLKGCVWLMIAAWFGDLL